MNLFGGPNSESIWGPKQWIMATTTYVLILMSSCSPLSEFEMYILAAKTTDQLSTSSLKGIEWCLVWQELSTQSQTLVLLADNHFPISLTPQCSTYFFVIVQGYCVAIIKRVKWISVILDDKCCETWVAVNVETYNTHGIIILRGTEATKDKINEQWHLESTADMHLWWLLVPHPSMQCMTAY